MSHIVLLVYLEVKVNIISVDAYKCSCTYKFLYIVSCV